LHFEFYLCSARWATGILTLAIEQWLCFYALFASGADKLLDGASSFEYKMA
jgi:hypothetical protein